MVLVQLTYLLVMNQEGFGNDSLVNKSYVDAVANGLDVKDQLELQQQQTYRWFLQQW